MCRDCSGTGRVTERVDRDPYGPTGSFVTVHSFCECEAGWALKARQIEAEQASFEAECAARAYADENAPPPWWLAA